MKTITNIKDLDNSDLSKEYKAGVRRIGEEFSIPDDEYDFGLQLGGDIHIVESIEDFQDVMNNMGLCDYADYIGQSQDPRYWTLLYCTNNAGGPSYLVPNVLVKMPIVKY
jgi:hypothetical protein